MPYGIKHVGGKWIVYNKDTGRAMGRHASKRKATAQLAALHIHVKEDEELPKGEALGPPSQSRSSLDGS